MGFLYQAVSWPAIEEGLCLEVMAMLEGAATFIFEVPFAIFQLTLAAAEECWEEVLTDMMTSSN